VIYFNDRDTRPDRGEKATSMPNASPLKSSMTLDQPEASTTIEFVVHEAMNQA
jgi:hypothetical protein